MSVSEFSNLRSGVPVLVIHGLYTTGLLMRPLAARLRRRGWNAQTFSYNSVRERPGASAERLRKLLLQAEAPTVHLVAHSLGGLIVRLALEESDSLPAGRIVTIGTPHVGSHMTRSLMKHRLQWLMGTAKEALTVELPPWRGQRHLGSIAGTVGWGMGRVFPGLGTPSDGTVSVQETRLPGMRDHICLPVSHAQMLISGPVATQCDSFLSTACFQH